MDMPKQMGAEGAGEHRQQQGDTVERAKRRETQQQLAETPAEQMRPVHFSDWASI
ncbi:hypothetical protein [Albidovulum sp.]|jgi:hypothetical protein|uniref:hypothetical protein n=1 Tax=Albidovulum sp. TaxID=1872424 RepID=UPI0039B9B166